MKEINIIKYLINTKNNKISIDKIIKKFYDQFKKQYSTFLGFIDGIPVKFDQEWYASLMLNRLMFIYFIQRKGFLNNDLDYLRTKLNQCQENIENSNPFVQFDGIFKDDPLFDQFVEDIAANRRELDAEIAAYESSYSGR
ncbi:MAG: hypothetical protein ACOVQ3_01350 [Dolichospermum sp.]|jgi:hypothetical protein